MEKEKLESLLIEYIDGKLNDAEKQFIEKELSEHEEVYALYRQLKEIIGMMDETPMIEPSENFHAEFDRLLKKEISKKETPVIFFSPAFFRVAASLALLIMAGGIGWWIITFQRQQAALESMRKEMEATKSVMMAMLDNRQSASQRLRGANVAYKMGSADDEIVNALVKAMNEDPNTNVRLAALDALGKFHRQEHVRKALIASLASQNDPVVQIALIRLMVDMKEKGIVRELQRITNDDVTLPAVKDEAHVGILRLS